MDGSSHFRGDELIVRNNEGDGIRVADLSTVGVSSAPGDTSQIVDNGGWGINFAGPSAVAAFGGQALFDPSVLDLTGNSLGETNCQ